MIRFTCPGCNQLIQAADSHVGKKVRCPKCHEVSDVPGSVGVAMPVAPISAKVLPPLVDESADDGEGDWPTIASSGSGVGKSAPPRPSSFAVPVLAIAVAAISVAMIGFAAYFFWTNRVPFAALPGLGQDPAKNVAKTPKREANEIVVGAGRVVVEVPQSDKEIEYRLRVEAGKAYRASLRSEQKARLGVGAPPGAAVDDVKSTGWQHFTFFAPKSGTMPLVVSHNTWQRGILTVEEMPAAAFNPLFRKQDKTEPPNVKVEQILDPSPAIFSAAFVSEEAFWTYRDDGSLLYWRAVDEPAFRLRLPEQDRNVRVAVGGKGSLFLAAIARIKVWRTFDEVKGPFGRRPENDPDAVVDLGWRAETLIGSPDGRWVFAMHSRGSVVRVDAHTAGVKGVLKNLKPQEIALTPDGKTLYCASQDGVIHVIDPETFTIRVSRPCGLSLRSIAASDDGLVFVCGHNADTTFNTYVVDSRKSEFTRSETVAFPTDRNMASVHFLPGPSAVAFADEKDNLTICDVPADPRATRPSFRHLPPSGRLVAVSPSGRRLLFANGALMTLDRAKR